MCCGREGSPQQRSPWPSTWPGALRTWRAEDLPVMVRLAGSPAHGGQVSGRVRIGKKWYNWAWVPGEGLCKEEGDVECPFLMPDPGDGTRPCALYGQTEAIPALGVSLHEIWQTMCESEPPETKTAEEVTQWQQRHPLCSYEWVE